MTSEEFEAAMQQALLSAYKADVDIRGGYYVNINGSTGFDVHITSVER